MARAGSKISNRKLRFGDQQKRAIRGNICEVKFAIIIRHLTLFRSNIICTSDIRSRLLKNIAKSPSSEQIQLLKSGIAGRFVFLFLQQFFQTSYFPRKEDKFFLSGTMFCLCEQSSSYPLGICSFIRNYHYFAGAG